MINKLSKSIIWHISILFNSFKIKRYAAYAGKNLRIIGKCYLDISKKATFKIGDSFTNISGYGFNPISRNLASFIHIEEGGSLEIGNNVGMSSTTIWAKTSIKIGNNVMIGADSIILDTNCHSLDPHYRTSNIMLENGITLDSLHTEALPIVIDDNVFIGARTIILKGVTIGKNSIIGAGSIVCDSIPSDVVAAGNPCKILKRKK